VLGAPLLAIAAVVLDEPERIWMDGARRGDRTGDHGLIYVASRGGMGDGDVRLAPLLGLYLGWLNPGIVPVGLFFGFLLGAVVGVVVLATRAGTAHGRAVRAVPGCSAPCGVFVGQAFVDLVLVR
jgi:leader peptidase (prepilin peptidase) / N-methyltransferase